MSKFDHLIEDGYSFNMGQYFSEGWDLFKRGAGSFIGFGILMIIIVIVVSIIPGVSLINGIISSALSAGIFLFCRGIKDGNEDFGMFFNGFNYFSQILLYSLVLFLFYIPALILVFTVMIPFEILPELFAGSVDPEYFAEDFAYMMEGRLGIFFGVGLLVFIMMIYLSVSYTFVLPLIVDEKMKFWDAMETSRKIVAKQFFSYLGMYFVLGIMLMLGVMLTCGLGYLIVTPVYACILFAAYDSILEPKKDDSLTSQIDEFGQQDHDINTESQDQ